MPGCNFPDFFLFSVLIGVYELMNKRRFWKGPTVVLRFGPVLLSALLAALRVRSYQVY